MRLQQRGGLSKQEISLTSFCRLLRRLGSSSVIAQSCWTTTRFFFLTWENRRKSSCSVSTSWRPPGKAGVNRYHLPGIFMTNSFRTWILAHLETLPCSVIPQQQLLNLNKSFDSISITWRKVSLCKWREGEVVSNKHLPRVGVVVAPVY